MVTIKLLNNNELSNIATNKSYILCEKLLVENHAGRH